ncbi:MAG: hypothetical protein HZA91_11035 [Verrucomicrobia bacterium]|nr:hypothetical protein [Verrucomicrobiota bacterium]
MKRHPQERSFGQAAHPQSGQILPVIACVLIAMVAILGLVIDAGMIQANRRHAQRAADAAAQAGARWLLSGTNAANRLAAISAAQLYAAQNLILANNVSVEIPPTSSHYFNGSNGYVRVLVTRPVNTTFMRLFLRLPTANVAAYATAAAVPVPIPVTILALDPTGRASLKISGGGTLRVVGGAVQVDSGNAQALSLDGGAELQADEINVVGGANNPDQVQGPLNTGAPYYPDPFIAKDPPVFIDHNTVRYGDGATTSNGQHGSWNNPNTYNINGGNHTLDPGIYYGGIKITGGNVTMRPGRYVMAGGGFSVSGNGTSVSGTDLFIYNTNDPFDPKGQGAFGDISLTGAANLQAPNTGADAYYKGLLFFNDRDPLNTTTVKLAGQTVSGNDSPLVGFVYSVNGQVQITGGAGSAGLGVVAWNISISGGGTLGVTDPTRIPDDRAVRLVE